MSRWISKHARYSFGLKTEVAEDRRRADGSWERVVVVPPLIAQFVPIAAATAEDEHAHASRHDLEVARSTWLQNKRRDGSPKDVRAIPSLTAGALGGIATVPFNPDTLFGVFDTDWLATDEERDLADAKLRDPQYGGIGIDYVEVIPVKVPAPWPNYDKLRNKRGGATVAEQVGAKVLEDGYDATAVLAYERANANRDDVVKALEEIIAAGDALAQDDDSALDRVI